MPNFEDTPDVTPEVIPIPDSHESEMPTGMGIVNIGEFIIEQEKKDKERHTPDNKPPLQ